ncbi:hypothetical protein M9435_002824 [Picochlorum sp. BPE23]|nr:hypothetical protein M9435_002824 [Picochlorum sp. BPE23]
MSLTPGGIQEVYRGFTNKNVRLQVLGLKKLESKQPGQSGSRYKVLLSDGVEAMSCILASQLASMADSNQIKENSIVDVHECIQNEMNQKRILIILSMTFVGACDYKIGDPKTLSLKLGAHQEGAGGAAHPPPPQQQQQQQHGMHGGSMYGAPPAPQQQQYPNMYGGAPQNAGGMYGGPPPATTGPGGMYGGGAAPPPAAGGGMYGGAAAPPPTSGGGMYGSAPPPQINGNYGATGYGMPQDAGSYKPAAGGAIARNEAPVSISPINSLNSYQNRWTIKARVTTKTPIKRYSNARGEGRFFSFDLLDADGGEIRVVGWNDQCDRFFDQVEQGRVYYISKASLRNKRGNYNQTRHQFEIHLESGSRLELAPDETSIPKISFNFVPINVLEDTPQGSIVDIIGVVESAAEVTTITRKDGSEAVKRSVSLRDPSGRSIEVTLWGEFASAPGDTISAEIASSRHPVVAIKGGRVGEFNGKNISTVSSSSVLLNPPEAPETPQLQQWYASGGSAQEVKPLSGIREGGRKADRRICISQIRGEGLGLGDQAAWVQAVCYMTYARNENFSYPACTLTYNGKQCNKKLADTTGDGTSWFCERCSANCTPEWRYILSCQLGDHSDASWVTAFNETAPDLLGTPAGQLNQWMNEGNPKFSAVFRDAQFKQFIVKLRLSEDKYQEEKRLRINVVRVDPMSFKSETAWTLDGISRLERGEMAYPPQQNNVPMKQAAPGYHQPAAQQPGMQQTHAYGNPLQLW